MNKPLHCLLIYFLIPSAICAQNNAVNSFLNSGGAALSNNGAVAHIGVIGQPLAAGNFSGTLVNSALMFSKDLKPPVVTFDPNTLSITLGADNKIEYRASDNDLISSNKLYYRPIGTVGEFQSVDMTAPVGNLHIKPILSTWYDFMGMEFYMEAKDKENTTRLPEGEETFFSYTIHPAPSIPTTLLSYGRTKANYRIIALPFKTDEPIANIFPELGSSDKKKYRIFKYSSGQWSEFPSFTTIERGEGFFIIMSDIISNVVLNMPQMKAPENNQTDPYKLSLTPGWNLIGNPYAVGINWDDVLVFNDNPATVGSELKIWTENSQYINVKDLAAYQGAFVLLEGSQSLEIDIPFKGQRIRSGGRAKEKDEQEDDGWSINLTINDGEEKNSFSSFGMHAAARLGFDRLDDLNPPLLEKIPIVKFLHPEHSQEYFSRDIVPLADAHTWDINIPSSNNENRILDWKIADLSVIGKDLFLYDMDGNAIVDMKTNTYYSFPSSSQNFRILFGDHLREEIYPDRITVLSPYPNPVSELDEVTFSIGIPHSQQAYTTQLKFYDALGNNILQYQWSLMPGLHRLKVKEEEMMRVNAGNILYYQLEIGAARFTGKIIYTPQK